MTGSRKMKLYNELACNGYIPLQIYQLLFLFDYFKKERRENEFPQFMEKIDPSYNADFLEQVIKCITHGTPYELFFKQIPISTDEMNELRRFLEDCVINDSEHISGYVEIAEAIIKNHWNPNVIYQFRRFIKCEVPLAEPEVSHLFSFIDNHDVHWMIINTIYNIYTLNYSVEELNEFLNDSNFLNLLSEYSVHKYEKIGDMLLIQIQDYAYSFIKKAK